MLAALLRCNTNNQFLGTAQQCKAVIIYVAKYMTKDGGAPAQVYGLLATCAGHVVVHESTAADAGTDCRTATHATQKALNTITAPCEYSHQQAAYAAFGGEAEQCTHIFWYLHPKQAVAFWQALQRRRGAANVEADTSDDSGGEGGESNDNDGDGNDGDGGAGNDGDGADDDNDALAGMAVDTMDDEVLGPHNVFASGADDHADTERSAGGATLYTVGDAQVPVTEVSLYDARPPEMDALSFWLFFRLVAVEKIPTARPRGGDGDAAEADTAAAAAAAAAADGEDDDQGGGAAQRPTVRRPANARFPIAAGHPLAQSHRFYLRSKAAVPVLANGPPPRYPGARPAQPSARWTRNANTFAAYMLVLFKPWRSTDPAQDVGPLTWAAFGRFVGALRASPAMLHAHTLAAMTNLAVGMKCSKAEQVAQSKYRVRNSDAWGAAGVERPPGPGGFPAGAGAGAGGAGDAPAAEPPATPVAPSADDLIRVVARNAALQGLADDFTDLADGGEALAAARAADEADSEGQGRAPDATDAPAPLTAALLASLVTTDGAVHTRAGAVLQGLKGAELRQVTAAATTAPPAGGANPPAPRTGAAAAADGMGPQTTATGATAADTLASDAAERTVAAAEADLPPALARADVQAVLATLNAAQRGVVVKFARFALAMDTARTLGTPLPSMPGEIILGGPGVGKTFMISALHNILGLLGLAGVQCLAFTGSAASLLPGGRTLHGALGLTVHHDASAAADTVAPARLAALQQGLGDRACILLIDECSMVDATMLQRVLARLQALAANTWRADAPQHGWAVILTGDFFQIEPTSGTALYKAILEATAPAPPEDSAAAVDGAPRPRGRAARGGGGPADQRAPRPARRRAGRVRLPPDRAVAADARRHGRSALRLHRQHAPARVLHHPGRHFAHPRPLGRGHGLARLAKRHHHRAGQPRGHPPQLPARRALRPRPRRVRPRLAQRGHAQDGARRRRWPGGGGRPRCGGAEPACRLGRRPPRLVLCPGRPRLPDRQPRRPARPRQRRRRHARQPRPAGDGRRRRAARRARPHRPGPPGRRRLSALPAGLCPRRRARRRPRPLARWPLRRRARPRRHPAQARRPR